MLWRKQKFSKSIVDCELDKAEKKYRKETEKIIKKAEKDIMKAAKAGKGELYIYFFYNYRDKAKKRRERERMDRIIDYFEEADFSITEGVCNEYSNCDGYLKVYLDKIYEKEQLKRVLK